MPVVNTLRERIKSYEDCYDIKLIKRLPVVIVLNGRSFKKITSLIAKPFSTEFMELMCATMIKLSQEVDGCFFSYSFNDEIVLISRNDQGLNTEAWYDNDIQKIASAVASIATLELNRAAKVNDVQLFGDPVFTAKTFVVPNMVEAVNILISKQQQCFHSSITLACFYELLKKYDIETVKQTIMDKSSAVKAEILFDNCGIEINNYPIPFRRGFACYRAPKIINIDGDEQIKNKLIIDMELPVFTKDHDFLNGIFKSGFGIFRAK